MLKNLKQKQEGFTIIEVMIVLVIAAVILLIVFLAVPALQRNSRNTQRKNDVSGILNAVNEWTSNNGGKYPSTDAQQQEALKNVKLGFYNNSYTSTFLAGPQTGNQTNTRTTETLAIVYNADCNGADAVAKTRSVAVLYAVETGGSPTKVCQSS